MKKKLSILSILLVLALALCAFAACGKGTANVTVLESEGEVLAIRADETKTDVSFGDVLLDLKESGKIQFEATNGDFGLYITSVNGHAADPNSEFWAVYTTLSEYEGVEYSNTDYGTFNYGELVLPSASVGVDGLPMIEGNLYVLVLTTF